MDTSLHLQSLFSSCGHFFCLWTLLVSVLFMDTSPHLQSLISVLWTLLLSVVTFSSSSLYGRFSSSSWVFVLCPMDTSSHHGPRHFCFCLWTRRLLISPSLCMDTPRTLGDSSYQIIRDSALGKAAAFPTRPELSSRGSRALLNASRLRVNMQGRWKKSKQRTRWTEDQFLITVSMPLLNLL